MKPVFCPSPLHPLPRDGSVPLRVWDSDVKGHNYIRQTPIPCKAALDCSVDSIKEPNKNS